MPYGLQWLGDARAAGYFIVVEGESDAWTGFYHGFPVLGIPGAGSAGVLEAEHLTGVATIYAVHEPDSAGDGFPPGIAARVKALGCDVAMFDMPLTDAKDLNESHKMDADGFAEALRKAMQDARPVDPAVPSETTAHGSARATRRRGEPDEGGDGDGGRGPSQATRLIRYAQAAGVELFHTPDGDAYAVLPSGSHRETWPLKSGRFHKCLTRLFYEETQAAAGTKATQWGSLVERWTSPAPGQP